MNGLAKATELPSRTGSGISETLSKMKFMQNKKEAAYREELQEKLEKSIKDSHWVAKGSFDGETLNTSSTSEVLGFKSVGRMSFGNFNSNLDKLNKEKSAQNKQIEAQRSKHIQVDKDNNIITFKDDDTEQQIKDKIINNKNNKNKEKKINSNSNNNNKPDVHNNQDNKLKNTIEDVEKFLGQVLKEDKNKNNNKNKRKNEENGENLNKKKFKK
ncbi:hypothetical protein RB653_002986 [Dictyostelium firmibasis]|uniref:Uncharacterized protein n=1 Tax=Dictyostelium firmibasis TaxID=79012 RepID=A0AAN7TZ68_9MYCE